ncbi:hypothetical protein [Mycolicibacterium setense]|uniref:hypothetical protein n=1 Tax=Mycolicibacterium setense TaxID=431269 RepID=UPI00103C7596|nr:hypothetical protein [Mycolicibacterium setense]MCV7110933.1 hypothetical protein [Mycolicibacterium setense]
MKPSEVFGRLRSLAVLAAIASAFMVVISSVHYMMTFKAPTPSNNLTHGVGDWLVFPWYGWTFVAALFLVAVLVLGVMRAQSQKTEANQAAAVRAGEQAARDRATAAANYARRQTELKNQIDNANSTAANLLDSLPDHLYRATMHLHQVEIDWNEHVYNPFWTSIEACACCLAEFKHAIEGIIRCAQQYRNAASEYDDVVPPFAVTSISVEAMNSYKGINETMAKFTRRAQADRDFANIFELWRGNAIMESGFANLRSAVQLMSQQISAEISSLHSTLDGVSKAINAQSREVSGAIAHQANINSLHHADVQRSLQESLRHEKKIANSLWNIERGYRPPF